MILNVPNNDAQAFKDVKVFAGDNFYPPADGSYANLIWEDLQTREIQNQLFAIIDEWGPLFRVSFNLIVHSQLTEAQDTEYPYSSVVTSKNQRRMVVNMGTEFLPYSTTTWRDLFTLQMLSMDVKTFTLTMPLNSKDGITLRLFSIRKMRLA